jgi:hypothetical protein
MEFTALFLAVTIAQLAAWCGSRPLALVLFAATLTAAVLTYLHHARDTLNLSFYLPDLDQHRGFIRSH